ASSDSDSHAAMSTLAAPETRVAATIAASVEDTVSAGRGSGASRSITTGRAASVLLVRKNLVGVHDRTGDFLDRHPLGHRLLAHHAEGLHLAQAARLHQDAFRF